MTIEGELTVRLAWDGKRVQGVAIESTRPFAAARVLAGRSIDEGAAIVPLLFSVCANAQGAAAAAALDAAVERSAPPKSIAQRERRVAHETVQEYLRALLIDGPVAVGLLPHSDPVAQARRSIARDGEAHAAERAGALRSLVAQHVLGMEPEAWLAQDDAGALAAWARSHVTVPARLMDQLLLHAPRLGRSDVAMMPAPTAEALTAAVVAPLRADPSFVRAPTWLGAPVETGALARLAGHKAVAALRRRHGNTAAVRLAARLAELATLVAAAGEADGAHAPPRVRAFPLAAGEGVATVDTARGLLLHRAVVVDGKVRDYQIVAPTEWNFHPQGPLAQGLAHAQATDVTALERAASIAVQALDPCVACRIEVRHA